MHCSARGQSPLIFDGNGEYNEELAKAGVLLTAEGIQPRSESARVKFSGSKRIVIDEPFAKTRELLAGYHLVECRNLDEALSIAHAFRRSRREARSRCAPLNRLTRTNSRQVDE